MRRFPQERMFAIAYLPFEQCEWREEVLCFSGDRARIQAIGVVGDLNIHVGGGHTPTYDLVLEFVRERDSNALAEIYQRYMPNGKYLLPARRAIPLHKDVSEVAPSKLTLHRRLEFRYQVSERIPVAWCASN